MRNRLTKESDKSSEWVQKYITTNYAHVVHLLLIVFLGLAVYSNTFSVPFMYDDDPYIRDNPAINSFQFFKDTKQVFELNVNPDVKNNFILRPLAYLTFAINYHLHGHSVFGYHLVNLILHIGSALLVYYLFAVSLKKGTMSNCSGDDTTWHSPLNYLPLIAGLLFVCHPLQTQSVTYIVQRFVPLATLFYLSSLVLYIQFRISTNFISRVLIYSCSMVAAVFAMESKEIAFTLPIIICLYEFIFLSGNISGRVVSLIPFLLTMSIIPLKLSQLDAPAMSDQASQVSQAINLVNFSDLTPFIYLITQFGVILTYIRLLLVPIGQKYDYDHPIQNHFFSIDVILPLIMILSMIGAGIFLLARSKNNCLYKVISFGIFWFFITLSVESSIIPISDLVIEHRVYLPSIGFFMSLLSMAMIVYKKLRINENIKLKCVVCLVFITVAGLSVATLARNYVWRDKIRYWQDAVNKSPDLWRPAFNLSAAYMEANRHDEAINTLIKSIDRNPDSFKLNEYFELKEICTRIGRSDIAFDIINSKKDILFDSFKNEIKVNPGKGAPHYKLGMVYLELYQLDNAIDEFNKARIIRSDKYEVYEGLAKAYIAKGKINLADKSLANAEKLAPGNPEILKLRRIIIDWQESPVSEF